MREQIKKELEIIKNKGKGYKKLEEKYIQIYFDLDLGLYEYMKYKLLFIINTTDNALKTFLKTTDEGLAELREEVLDLMESYFMVNRKCA